MMKVEDNTKHITKTPTTYSTPKNFSLAHLQRLTCCEGDRTTIWANFFKLSGDQTQDEKGAAQADQRIQPNKC